MGGWRGAVELRVTSVRFVGCTDLSNNITFYSILFYLYTLVLCFYSNVELSNCPCMCVCDSSDPKVKKLFDAFIYLMIYYDQAGAFSFLGSTFCAEFSRQQ